MNRPRFRFTTVPLGDGYYNFSYVLIALNKEAKELINGYELLAWLS